MTITLPVDTAETEEGARDHTAVFRTTADTIITNRRIIATVNPQHLSKT